MERNPQEHAQQAPLSSYKAVVESGANCGVFLIPQKRDNGAWMLVGLHPAEAEMRELVEKSGR